MLKITLYECFNAKVNGDKISCCKGHLLGSAFDGTVPVRKLLRGFPLAYTACLDCPDFDSMGPPLLPEDRGWESIIKKGASAQPQ